MTNATLLAAAKLPHLRHLDVTGCTSVTSDGITAFAAATQSQHLESLILDDCHQLRDPALTALAGGCQTLKTLSVRRCGRLTDEGLAAVAEACALQVFCVSGVHGVGVKTVLGLTKGCKDSLESCDLSFCCDLPQKALGLLVDSCSKLGRLKVYGCSQVGKEFLWGHGNEGLLVEGVGTAVKEHVEPFGC